jgi:mutator protein MutT
LNQNPQDSVRFFKEPELTPYHQTAQKSIPKICYNKQINAYTSSMLKIYYHNSNAPQPNRPILPSVHGIIINKSREVLLHRREDSSLWAIPGGKIKIDESIEQCLKREMREELEVEVSAKRLLGIYTDPSYIIASDKQVQRVFLIVFLCTIKKGKLKLTNETEEYRWFKKKDLSSIKAFPLVKEIAIQALNNKNKIFFD